MEIEDTGLFTEISSIMALPKIKPFEITAILHTEGNNKNFPATKVVSLDIDRDFEMNYSDSTMITLLLPAGVYANDIYPYQGDIDITLYRLATIPETGEFDRQAAMLVERYTAVLVDTGDKLSEGNYGGLSSKTALDLMETQEVVFQLLDKSLEQMRMASFGISMRLTTAGDALRAIMTSESAKLKLPNARRIKGTDMVPASDTTVREHVIVPQGIRVVDLPMYFQNECGGIYNAGMGYFLAKDYWYIYPMYDTGRFNTAKKTLTIIRVPPKRYPALERTFRVDGSNTVILANGEAQFRGDSDSQQLTFGNGVRFADASKMMEGFSETVDGKTLFSRGDSNSEFTGVPRENGINNIQLSDNPITSNQMVEFSKLARRNGSVMAFLWQNSNGSLIMPGMPVRIFYIANGKIISKFGVVLKSQEYIRMTGEGLLSQGHTANTMISVFLQGTQPK